MKQLEQDVIEWAKSRGIFASSDSKSQCLKFIAEAGEVAEAVLTNDLPEIEDGIGDTMVTLILLAHMNDLDIEQCLQSAYNVISKRTGKMINGAFVKDSD